MSRSKKMAGFIALLVVTSLVLGACTTEPTQDPAVIFTQAAQTVQAQMTQSAAAAQPTQDPAAIFTQAAGTIQAQLSQTAAAKPTETQQPTTSTTLIAALPGVGTPAAGLALPALATPTLARGPVADKCEYVTQFPLDNAEYSVKFTSQSEDWYWEIKNSGQTTWSKNYQYRFYSGKLMTQGGTRAYSLKSDVKPGDSVKLYFDPQVPGENGSHVMTWVLTNADGANFCVFDMTIKASGGGGSSNPSDTATPNTLAWMCSDASRSSIQGRECFCYCKSSGASPCYTRGKEYVDGMTPVNTGDDDSCK